MKKIFFIFALKYEETFSPIQYKLSYVYAINSI